MQGNSGVNETEREALAEAAGVLRRLLPGGWDLAYSLEPPDLGLSPDLHSDALLTIHAPDRSEASLLVEVKAGSSLNGGRTVDRLRRLSGATGLAVLLVAPYLGPAIRQRCESHGVSFLDLTGWCRLDTSSPALVIRSVGASRDPRPPRSTAIQRLNGMGAGRVIRSLLDDELPAGVRDIARRAAVSPGTVSKVLKALEPDVIVARGDAGRVQSVQKRHLVDRWVHDYSFLRTNTVAWCLAPRGIGSIVEELESAGGWAVATGSLAARRQLPESTLSVSALAQLALYVPRLPEAARRLGLVPTERSTANVLLARPYDTQLLAATAGATGGVPVVSPGQAVADLKTMPGRAPQEADQLMDHLAVTDDGWR